MVAAHLIRFVGGGEFSCSAGDAVLIAMERQGLAKVPVGCRGGGCGVCKVRVAAGTYILGKMSRAHVSESEEEQGYALACKVFPTSALVLEPIGKLLKCVN